MKQIIVLLLIATAIYCSIDGSDPVFRGLQERVLAAATYACFQWEGIKRSQIELRTKLRVDAMRRKKIDPE